MKVVHMWVTRKVSLPPEHSIALSIYIAFRGSSTVSNWISDFNVKKTPYKSFPECDCEVSEGWYHAEQSIIDEVLNEVQTLTALFPDYVVKVTGHSYGAAIAQLTSMDLIKHGYPCSVYNFGQPRTGDQKYSDFVGSNKSFPQTWRVVHNRDIVPHWPFYDYMGYVHVCSEEFEDESGNLKSCGFCEDPNCSGQFDEVREWRPDDHMTYLGLPISCDTVS